MIAKMAPVTQTIALRVTGTISICSDEAHAPISAQTRAYAFCAISSRAR